MTATRDLSPPEVRPPGASIAADAGRRRAGRAGARARVATTVLAALALLVAIAGCGSGAGAAGPGQVKVVATTTQLADFARAVGGERAKVVQILQVDELWRRPVGDSRQGPAGLCLPLAQGTRRRCARDPCPRLSDPHPGRRALQLTCGGVDGVDVASHQARRSGCKSRPGSSRTYVRMRLCAASRLGCRSSIGPGWGAMPS
jgi:hypothetical protein